jgi:glycosyltransferase involved in cell wall biosynthesis
MSTQHTPPLVSVVIPARNEFPQIAFTIQSIINDLETFLKPNEFEIIICANCCNDWYGQPKDKRAGGGTVDYLMPRGIYWNRMLRVIYDPIAGNHSTRNKGALLARGKYLFFSDGHMSYKRGYFQRMIRAIDETGGLVHGTIGWLGAYPPGISMGYQYTIKLGEEIKGTWNNYRLTEDDYFYVPMQGHCCLGVLREQFLKFDGYPAYTRCYGGGEFYIDMKWWMFGSTVCVDPQAIGYHLCAPRGYSYNHDDYVFNVLAIGTALGMEGWTERAYLNWLRRGNLATMERLMTEAKRVTKEDRKYISKKAVKSVDDILLERPWDVLNDAKHGKHNGSMLIFHDTWLHLIKGTPAEELYNKSELQKKLATFIEERLPEFIYKRGWHPKEEMKDERIIPQ